MGELAKILIYGDIHLNSKNYGAHVDYANESLNYYKKITEIVKERGATHLIGLGDFTFGRFHTLEYRTAVETELMEQYRLVNGNHYELKGNHDKASYGMTEYEYYITKGLIKPSCNMTIGDIHITMVDYGQETIGTPNIGNPEKSINVVFGHNLFRFSDSSLPNMGKSIELDSFDRWFGVDYIISGHIHKQFMFDGLILKTVDGQTYGHRAMVQYPGCLSRPSYTPGSMDEVGQLILLTVKDNCEMQYDVLDVELLPIDESFNMSIKQAEKEAKEEKEKRVDISDIIQQLNGHNRGVGNPEDIIESLSGIDDKYKKKAIDLLHAGMG